MSPVVIAPVVIARSGSDEAIPRSGMNRIAAHALGLDPRVAIAPRNDNKGFVGPARHNENCCHLVASLANKTRIMVE
jgi:hypothetical protein